MKNSGEEIFPLSVNFISRRISTLSSNNPRIEASRLWKKPSAEELYLGFGEIAGTQLGLGGDHCL